jgi:hypothetical protein
VKDIRTCGASIVFEGIIGFFSGLGFTGDPIPPWRLWQGLPHDTVLVAWIMGLHGLPPRPPSALPAAPSRLNAKRFANILVLQGLLKNFLPVHLMVWVRVLSLNAA